MKKEKMFSNESQKQNNNLSSEGNKSSASANSHVAPENLPVHSMKEDLKGLGNVNIEERSNQEAGKINFASPNSTSNTSSNKGLFSSQEKEGQVISQSEPKVESKVEQKEKVEIVSPENIGKKEKSPKNEMVNLTSSKNDTEEHHGLGRVIIVAVIIAVLALIAFGGYYFWITKNNNSQSFPEDEVYQETKKEEALSEGAISEEEIEPSFSQTEMNYLMLDLENMDSILVKKTLQKYAKEVVDSKVVFPVKFSLVDENNQPITFSVFANKLGLKINANILSQLEEAFSFYIYNDNGTAGFGLAISSKDKIKLKTALSQNEKTLVNQLGEFLPGESKDWGNIVFQSSKYDNADIRYVNLDQKNNLSIDYTILDKELLIGTSKMTLRSILGSKIEDGSEAEKISK